MVLRNAAVAASLAMLLLLTPRLVGQAATSSAGTPAMQLAPDAAAFQAANATVDPQARIAALDGFVHSFPKSRRVATARRLMLDLLLAQPQHDEHRIHTLAALIIDSVDKNGRANTENSVSYALAEALPSGVDLKWAEKWAKDAVDQATLEAVARQFAGPEGGKNETPEQKARQEASIRQYWAVTRAANLQTLADVYLHEGKLAEATAAVDEAQKLDPSQGASYLTRGQIEHTLHHDDKALDALETAEVYGGMTVAGEQLLTALYTAQHGGGRSGLDAEIDRRYQALFKPVPVLAHSASSSGRSVLMALYTGAGCEPCVAADLAMNAVLRDYNRTEVIALAFDEHIPLPDPLANPASVARAAYDGVHYTPTLRIDGEEPKPVFGRRADAEKAYRTLAAALDAERDIPSGTVLRLFASLTPERTVHAKADFAVSDADALGKVLARKAAAPGAAGSAAAETAATREPKLILNFALVQREVRYSGENGIRFHAMVVRDVAKPSAEAFPVALHGASSASFVFDPAAISASLGRYLAEFSRHNERFAAPQLLSTDTSLPLEQLSVAAWVEDLASHRVVAAAYSPLSIAGRAEQAAR